MKAIFNSLGSNYDKFFWWKVLWSRGNKQDSNKLKSLLEQRYSGKALLFYKGREALFAALTLSGLPSGSKVAVTGFTCYAVCRAIVDTGYQPVYVDISKDSLNFDSLTLQETIKNNPDIKAVIIQNTLGYACDIDAIIKVARQHDLIIIEDLAHSIGTTYANQKEAGTIGDFTALSFSQDKVVDGVSGGALIVHNDKYIDGIKDLAYTPLGRAQKNRDRYYPLLTSLIRSTYNIGLGKLFHFIFKKLHIMARAVDGIYGVMRTLPNWYCRNIVVRFNTSTEILKHRKNIANVYKKILPASVCFDNEKPSTYLRFPIVVDSPKALFKSLSKSIHITDTWYDVPVAPRRYFANSQYKAGTCPNSEWMTEHIVNLPTHINISAKQAAQLAKEITKWLSR